MLNTLIIIGKVESVTQHTTKTGNPMSAYRIATTAAAPSSTGGVNTTYHTVLGFAPHGINTTLQQGDIVCVVGRVQLRKSAHHQGAMEYSCIAESVTQVSESQAEIVQEEIAEHRQKLSAMQKRCKTETSRVGDVMSANATKRPSSGDIAW